MVPRVGAGLACPHAQGSRSAGDRRQHTSDGSGVAVGRFDGWVRSVGEDPDPRFTLANERTFLSWMTTSLGLLGVGLAVGSLVPTTSPALTALSACWIAMSVLVAVRALVRWFRLERAMRHNEALPLSSSIPVVAIALGGLGLASGIALLLAR